MDTAKTRKSGILLKGFVDWVSFKTRIEIWILNKKNFCNFLLDQAMKAGNMAAAMFDKY